MRPSRRSWLGTMLIALVLAAGAQSHAVVMRAVVDVLVDPGRVSAGVVVSITGTGFNKTAASNEVEFTAEDGTVARVIASAVATVNEDVGTRRLAVLVPALPDGPMTVRVRNIGTGVLGSQGSARIVSITPSVTTLDTGTSVALVVTGSPGIDFVAGTRVALGSGIKVKSVTVESPTRLVAQIAVSSSAKAGPRTLEVIAPGLSAIHASITVVRYTPPVNVAPEVEAGPDQAVMRPDAATLLGSVNDDGLPAGKVLKIAWSKVSGPGKVTFANAASPATTATFSKPGTYVLRLKASDGKLTTIDTVSVVATDPPPVNKAPTVEAGPDRTVTMPKAATLAGKVTDDALPQGRVLTLQWSQFSGPGTTTFSAPTSARTSATFSAAGTYVLRLLGSDGDKSATDTVTVVVNPAPPSNVAPTVNAGPDQAIATGGTATLVGSVTDDGLPAGKALKIAWSKVSGPGSVSFASPSSATTTARFAKPGTYVLQLKASDTKLNSSDTVTVIVSDAPPTNVAPTVNAGPDQTVTLPAAATLAGTATDDGLPQGNTLTVQWAQVSGPGATTFASPASPTTTATFTVAGTYVLQLTASDGTLTASDTVTVVVSDVPPTNVAPTVSAGPDQTVTLPAAASLAGTATDDGLPQGNTLTVQWAQVSGPGATTFAAPASPTTTATFTAAGTYVLQLTASDGTLSASDTVTVTATAPGGVSPNANSGPVVDAGPDRSVTLPAGLTLLAQITDDGLPTASTLQVRWEQISGPAPAELATPLQASTDVAFPSVGPYVLRVHASDGELSAFDDIRITVSPAAIAPNAPPTVTTGPDATIVLPSAIALTASVDDDGNPAPARLTLTWAQSSGPGVAVIDDAGASTTTATAPVPGTYVFTARVSDGALSGSDDITVVVQPAPPPVNAAPTLTVTGDARVTLPGAATLVATAADDGRPTTAPPAVVWAQVSGPGVAVFAAPAATSSAVTFSLAGTYTLRATATDGELSTSADLDVVVDPAPPLNAMPRVSAGADAQIVMGAPLDLIGQISDDGLPGGSSLAVQWAMAIGPSAVAFGTPGSPTTSATFGMPGRYVLELTASDGELVGSDTLVVTVLPAEGGDLLAPVVTVDAPARALPGAEVRVTARVSDDVGVATVTFTVDGTTREPLSSAPFVTVVTLPEVAAPGQQIRVRATVRDAAGRTGEDEAVIEIAVTADVQPPSLDLLTPTSIAPGNTLVAHAEASDESGIARVEFFVDEVSAGVIDIAPYDFSLVVPAGRPLGPLTVRADAFDNAGNRASVGRVVQIASDADTTAPIISLQAPTSAPAGSSVRLEATVTDPGGLADVEFLLSGLSLGFAHAAPWTIDFVVPELPAGTALTVRARARDLSGNTSDASAVITVVERALTGIGLVTGRVFDDTTGLAVSGARVVLRGGSPGSADTSRRVVVTDEAGRYAVDMPAGPARVVVEKDGHVSAIRAIDVPASAIVAVVDARLTPLGAVVNVAPAAGQRLTSGSHRLDVAAGGVASSAALTFTSVTGQGLTALLPAGWAPLAAAHVGPAGQSFVVPALLRLVADANIPAGRVTALVIWDPAAESWRVVSSDVAAVGGAVEQAVTHGGQYVLVLADGAPVAPAAPVAGAPLEGVARPDPSESVQSTVTPDPRVIFAAPDARSLVTGQVTSTAPVTSGLVLQMKLDESYRFFGGEQWQPTARLQDVVLYQRPATPLTSSSTIPVGPSRQFDAVTLDRGVIGVELRIPEQASGGGIVGTAGGTVSGDGETTLDVPAGAVDRATQVSVRRVAPDTVSVPLPPGVTALDAVEVVMPSLARPADLSLPRPAGLLDVSRAVVARVTEIRGRTAYVLAGLVAGDGARVRVVVEVGGQPTGLPGIASAGTYVLLQTAAPVGFAAGRVVDPVGAAVAGAVVTPSTLPVVSIATGAGAYFVAAPAGAVVMTAADEPRGDRGERPAFLTAQVISPLTLTVQPVPPQVTSVRPADGAAGVLLDDPISVMFSEPVVEATLAGAVRLVDSDGVEIAIDTTLTRGGTVLEVHPSLPLTLASTYTLSLATAIADLTGHHLPAVVSATFRTVDLAGPGMPPAGTITASVPDAGGRVTVKGTQGTAAPGTRIFVENTTRGTSVLALAGPDGSFAAGLVAAIADRLRVRIVDASENTTTVDIEGMRQQNPDGSVSQVVAAAGGVVEGPEGTRATIKPGTFPDGAVVTIKPVPVAEFPRQLTAAERENFSLEKAISLDFGGATPQDYVDVSWPAAPTDKPTDQWVLTESIFVRGEWAMNITDTVKYRDGRLTTASPPCPGVTAAAVYGLLKSSVSYGLNYAQMYADGRYKLKMSLEVFQGSPIAIPYAAFSAELPRTICFPAFIGRMSISPNSTRLGLARDDLRPADNKVVVAAPHFSAPLEFSRVLKPIHVRVYGYADDVFNVYGIGPDGETKLTSIRTQPRGLFELDEADADMYNAIFDALPGAPTPQQQDHVVTVQPEDIKVPVTALKIVAVRARKSVTVPVGDQVFIVNVPGGPGAPYQVEIGTAGIDWELTKRVIEYLPSSAAGNGNLVLRASQGTIDPTRAEMGNVSGPARESLTLTSSAPGFTPIVIPPELIIQGGLEYAFDGPAGAVYTVITGYDTRPDYAVELPTVKYVLRNVNTSQVLKTIFGQAPPRDEPVALPPLTDDDVKPTLLSAPSRMDTFDPAGLLMFRFSESMDPTSLRKAIVVRDGSKVIAGEVRISDRNRVATFVPTVPLDLGERYTVEVIGGDGGAKDLAGNAFERTATFNVQTFRPRSLDVEPLTSPGAIFKDTAWLFRDNGTERKRHLFTVMGGFTENVRWLDGTDPTDVTLLATTTGSQSQQRIAAIDTDTLSRLGEGKQMLIATTLFNPDRSEVGFYHATEPGNLSSVGSVALTLSPDKYPERHSDRTVKGMGFARKVVLHETTDNVRATIAVEKYGVMSVDVRKALEGPSDHQNAFPMEGVKDIDGYHDGVVAAGMSPGGKPVVYALGPSLDLQSSLALSGQVTSVDVALAVPIDINRDGEVPSSEYLDIAIIGTTTGITVARLSDRSGDISLQYLFSVATGGIVRDVEIDAERSRVIAMVDESVSPYLQIIDLARGDVDPVDNEEDPRIIYRRMYTAGSNGMRLDRESGLLYISTPSGLDTWLVADRCCDLGVELTADLDKKAKSVVSGGLGDVLAKELHAIKRGVVLGLERAQATCPGFEVSQLKLIESGSSACLWSADPERACGSNYQPLVSDHDISTFMPDDWYEKEVEDPNWDGEGTPDKILLAGCVVAGLSYPFMDPITEEPKAVGATGIVFKDISFIPNFSKDFDDMKYRLERTIEGLPGDVDNDLAMGRQLLAMKHLTEAYGVDLRGAEGYRPAYAAVMVDEAAFERQFKKFREVTRIPEVEGYEWGVLMQFMLAKAKAYVRFKGASDERSTFNDLYVKQYHTAGKAGIRAAAARIVSDSRSRDLFLQLRREDTGENDGLLAFRKNACLLYLKNVSMAQWPSKPCGSMEEYVAATAVRAHLQIGLFDEATALEIHEFYRVKSDEQAMLTEGDADDFIARVHRFVMKVKTETWPIYTAMLASDPEASDRRGNREYAEGEAGGGSVAPGGRIAHFLANTKIAVKPKVYNRGFMGAPQVYLRAYIAPPGAPQAISCVGTPSEGEEPDPAQRDRCRLELNLPGGSMYFPAYRHDTSGDYMPIPTSKSVDAFAIKVDQRTHGQIGHIAFTLDLPERSANEADRQNNMAGSFFYILDPAVGVAPPGMGETVPMPVDPSLLAPDPYCLEAPGLTITQSVVLDGEEYLSPVPAYLKARYTLKLAVTNTGSSTVENVLACSTLSANCPTIGDLGPGETKVQSYELEMPAQSTNLESVATAESRSMGISTTSLLRIGARCEPMLLPLNPDPNPTTSLVRAGGRAVRHYMLVHPTMHTPVAGRALTFGGSFGTNLEGHSYMSDANGLVVTAVGTSARPIEGLAIPARAGGQVETWKLTGIGDLPIDCNRNFSFDVQSSPLFPYLPSIEAGSAIRTGFTIFGKGGELDFGGGLRIELPSQGLRLATATNDKVAITPTVDDITGVTWERKAKVGVSGSFGIKGFSAEGEFRNVAGSASGLSLSASGTASATQSYRYHFQGNPRNFGTLGLDGPFFALMFPNMSEAEANAFRQFNFETGGELAGVLKPMLGSEEPYRAYRTARVGGFSVSGEAAAKGFSGTIDFVGKKPEGEKPQGDENKSTPLFAANAAGSASAAVGYEKFEVLEPGQNEEFDAVTEMVHTIDVVGKYDWKSSYATSFSRAEQKIRSGSAPDAAKDKAVELLKWVEGRLSNSETGAFDGGIRFRIFAKPGAGAAGAEYHMTKLEVGFKTAKSFGYVDESADPAAQPGNEYRINFVIEGEGEAERVLRQAIGKTGAFIHLLSDAEKRRTSAFLESLGDVRDLMTEQPPLFNAQDLYDNFLAFVMSLFDHSNVASPSASTYFYEEVRRVKGDSTDLGLGDKAKVIGFSVDPMRLEYVTTHESARGIIYKGKGYLLEDYSAIQIEPPDGKDLLLTIIENRLDQVYDGLGRSLRAEWEEYERGKAKGDKADVSASNSIDARLLDVVSFSVKDSPAPVPAEPYRGNSDVAPAGKPRYGVGDFYSLLATDTLSGPVTLSFRYEDSELAGIDESTLRLYRFDSPSRDWTPVPASIDLAANRVTATVTDLGLYTLAPRMPAGRLAWQVLSWSAGSGATTVTFEASGLRMNDGSPLAPGALVHVRFPQIDPSLVTFGTADASAMPGHQVLADGDGKVRVTVTVPGAIPWLEIRGFSDIGTAFGQATLERP